MNFNFNAYSYISNYNYRSIGGIVVPEDYFDTLPEDLEYISLTWKKIKFTPNFTNFRNLTGLVLSGCKMKTLPVLPNSLQNLIVSNMDLEYLPSLENTRLEFILASDNNLTSLPSFPDTLLQMNFIYNKIKNVEELPDSIISVSLSFNRIKKIKKFPKNAKMINISQNFLKELPTIPENVYEFYCIHNPLIVMPEIKSIKINYLAFASEVNGYLNSDEISEIMMTVRNINIINNFKSTYYHLLCKSKLRKILWEKVREPKIKEMYHPDKLIELIKDVDAEHLEEVLDKWCN